MHVFEMRTATGSELSSLLTCFHATTFTLRSIFSPLEMISTKIWETPLSWLVKCSLPVAVHVSKTRVLISSLIFTMLRLDRVGESNTDNLNCYSCDIMFSLSNIEAV